MKPVLILIITVNTLPKITLMLRLIFFDAARSTFVMLAKMPFIGKRYAPNDPRLEDLRQWRIKQFTSHFIFYRVTEESIEIVRILNAAQDVDRILRNESD